MKPIIDSNSDHTNNLGIYDIVLVGILSATLTAGKLVLAFVPNVEIVTLLFILYTVTIGPKKALLTAGVFSTIEIFIYGFNTWILGYYIIWPVLILISWLLRKTVDSEYGYAIVGGLFGLFFGMFFAVFEAIFYGWAYGLSYWIRGIPMDILHGVSNFIIILLLFKPLSRVLEKAKTGNFS